MKRFLILFLIFSITFTSSFSQDYKKVDSIVKTYSSKYKSITKLAEQIEKDFSNDFEKVRAVYNWITTNIYYDIKESGAVSFSYSSVEDYNKKNVKKNDKLSKRVMSKKIAVCEGYATLFYQLCIKLNIKSKIVSGFGKTQTSDIGKRFSSNHAWNIVELNNKEYLIDTTWGVNNNEIDYTYFLGLPKYFILSHYPNNIKDALLEKPISKQTFLNNPLYYKYYFDVVSPINGTISKSKKEPTLFSFKTKKKVYSVSLYIKKQHHDIKIIKNENTLDFEIDVSKFPNARELIIYFDNEAAIGYKLIR